ncbi:MAG TPA: hypothetical protein VIK81_04480 [Patescibacteria group bacterium]
MIEMEKEKLVSETRFFKLNNIQSQEGGLKVLIGARDVGPVRAILPLIKELPLKEVYFLSDGVATEELVKKEEVSEIKEEHTLNALSYNPDLILTSGEVTPAIADTLTLSYQGSKALEVWLEDVPNSLRNRKGRPDLVICFNQESRNRFLETHNRIFQEDVISLGINPDFFRLNDEKVDEINKRVRKELGFSKDDIVITFIGSKSSDIPQDPGVLKEVAEIIDDLSKELDRDFILIRRDHPGDPNPELYDKSTEVLKSDKVRLMGKGSELMSNFSTAETCCASDVLIGVSSTVFDEAAYRGALRDKPGSRGTLVVHRHFEESHFPVIESGASLVARNRGELKEKMKDLLFNKELQTRIWEAQKVYAKVDEMEANLKRVNDRIVSEVGKKRSSRV